MTIKNSSNQILYENIKIPIETLNSKIVPYFLQITIFQKVKVCWKGQLFSKLINTKAGENSFGGQFLSFLLRTNWWFSRSQVKNLWLELKTRCQYKHNWLNLWVNFQSDRIDIWEFPRTQIKNLKTSSISSTAS